MTELLRADDDAWRVSLATIDTDGPVGPVGRAPGARRLLTLVDGTVLRLLVDGVEHVVEPGRPVALAADAEITASLPEGPVRLLDVTTSAEVEAFVTVLELGRTSTLPLAADQAAYVLKGSEADSLVAGPAVVSGRCTLAVITLQRR